MFSLADINLTDNSVSTSAGNDAAQCQSFLRLLLGSVSISENLLKRKKSLLTFLKKQTSLVINTFHVTGN